MTVCVLDVSVTISAMIEEERSEEARVILGDIARGGAFAPSLWVLEVGHILLIAERRRLLGVEERERLLQDLARLPVTIDPETVGRAWTDTTALARRHRLSLYDAAYLELSLRRRLPLATFDVDLRRAATAAGVTLT